jgi:hypothetical protein
MEVGRFVHFPILLEMGTRGKNHASPFKFNHYCMQYEEYKYFFKFNQDPYKMDLKESWCNETTLQTSIYN